MNYRHVHDMSSWGFITTCGIQHVFNLVRHPVPGFEPGSDQNVTIDALDCSTTISQCLFALLLIMTITCDWKFENKSLSIKNHTEMKK